jgi:hypothetical protein
MKIIFSVSKVGNVIEYCLFVTERDQVYNLHHLHWLGVKLL